MSTPTASPMQVDATSSPSSFVQAFGFVPSMQNGYLQSPRPLPTPERRPLQPVNQRADESLEVGNIEYSSEESTRRVTFERAPLELPISSRRTASQPIGLQAAPMLLERASTPKEGSAVWLPTMIIGLPSPSRGASSVMLPTTAPVVTPTASRRALPRGFVRVAGGSPVVTPSPAGRTVLPNFPSPGPLGSPIGGGTAAAPLHCSVSRVSMSTTKEEAPCIDFEMAIGRGMHIAEPT
eukprot:CAMPEP_0197656100 /NCGR_PEP_ID=MMETSP1338-20131121/40258_1 /TAXON_ID=43686 ORGANISM="Pelagodinium beii, Strain RCC1491" /NCGR_SAMPLE_ID=MMETSP1338 /ASSEMBLY_ACC=CAM_ASM_000754 /LENGTH=236 /DNA_ID=CAMNT_0043231923 /DNA_START=33 /DNA_END=744 /DNA_ORIENTATION=-